MNYFKLSYLIALCSLAFTQSKNSHYNSRAFESSDSTIVIINQTGNVKEQFRYFDYYGNSELSPFPKTDTLYLKTSHSIIAYNTNGGNFTDITYYPLFPKDTLYLTLREGKEILISKNKALDKKIGLMSMLFFSATSRNYPPNSGLTAGLRSIDTYYLNKKHILQSNQGMIDNKTLKYANEIIEYDKLASVLTLYTKLNKKDDSILKVLDKADTTAWDCMTLRDVIFNYNIYLNKVYHVNSPRVYTEYIYKNFPKAIQDYAIFFYLKNYKPIDKEKLQTLSELIKDFNEHARNRDFANNLNDNLEKYKENFEAKDSNNVTLLSLQDNKPIKLQLLLQQHRGTIIYIDFWASWCAPCLAEMPESHALAQKFKNEKSNILFLYLSKDEDMSAWKHKSSEVKLPINNSFIILNNKAFVEFSNKLNLKAIPRYMIIGKKGEIIDQDAPRPSDLKLNILLNKLSK